MNSGGVTPMIVNGTRLRVMDRPMTSAAPPNLPLPEGVADDGDGGLGAAAAAIVRRGVNVRPRMAGTPRTSKNSPLAHRPSTGSASPPLRQIELLIRPRGGAGKQLLLAALDLLPDRVGRRVAVELDELLRFGTGSVRSSMLLTSVKMAVLAPMPERQRQHGDGGERPAVREHPEAVAQVGDQILEPARAPLVAAVLLGLIETAELRRGLASRLGLAQPVTLVSRPPGVRGDRATRHPVRDRARRVQTGVARVSCLNLPNLRNS